MALASGGLETRLQAPHCPLQLRLLLGLADVNALRRDFVHLGLEGVVLLGDAEGRIATDNSSNLGFDITKVSCSSPEIHCMSSGSGTCIISAYFAR